MNVFRLCEQWISCLRTGTGASEVRSTDRYENINVLNNMNSLAKVDVYHAKSSHFSHIVSFKDPTALKAWSRHVESHTQEGRSPSPCSPKISQDKPLPAVVQISLQMTSLHPFSTTTSLPILYYFASVAPRVPIVASVSTGPCGATVARSTPAMTRSNWTWVRIAISFACPPIPRL